MKLKLTKSLIPALALCFVATGCNSNLNPTNVGRTQPVAQPAPVQQPTPQPVAQPAPAADLRPLQTAIDAAQQAAEQARDNSNAMLACDPNQPDYGTSDCDDDGIKNGADACPRQSRGDEVSMQAMAYNRRGCPDVDTDQDGLGDTQDACPNTPKGEHEDTARRGCPDIDSDRDGVYDSGDECHLIPVQHTGTTPDAPAEDQSHPGCPENAHRDADNDGDGIRDYRDLCPTQVVGDDPHPQQLGCPDIDSDRDGWVDRWDGCPNLPVRHDGTTANAPANSELFPGCPEGRTPTNERAPNTQLEQPAQTVQPTPAVTAATPAQTAVASNGRFINGPDLVGEVTRQMQARFGEVEGNLRTQAFCKGAIVASDITGRNANENCSRGLAYCFRPVTDHVQVNACGESDNSGNCQLANGHLQNACLPAAAAIVTIRCGEGVVNCDVTNLAGAIVAREPATRRHSSRSARRHTGLRVAFGLTL